jgi:hypothetical protein
VAQFQLVFAHTGSHEALNWSVFLVRGGILGYEQDTSFEDSSWTTLLCIEEADLMRQRLNLQSYFRFASIRKMSRPTRRPMERQEKQPDSKTHAHTQNEDTLFISILER